MDQRRHAQLRVDGICCDSNRIQSVITLLRGQIKATAIHHWRRNQGRNTTSSLYLEVFNSSRGATDKLFTVAASDVLHVGPNSYVEAKTNLHEAILSLLGIAGHEPLEPRATWAEQQSGPH